MFSTSIIRQALASADVTHAVASAPSIPIRDGLGIPRMASGRISKTRKPRSDNAYAPSLLRPHILAFERLCCWVSPQAFSHHTYVTSQISLSTASTLMEVMLSSLEPKTRSNYGASLLHFTQFCDLLAIPKNDRCPASEVLVLAFIASYAGKRSTECINGWLAGLKFWHTFQGAPWLGGPMLCSVKKGVAKLVPDESHQDKSEPVTLKHLHCLLRNLDLSNSKDAAVFSASTAAFHGICRYCRPLYLCFIFPLRVLFRWSELCVPSCRLFDPSKHVSNSTCINFGITPSGVCHANFHIPWSKTEGPRGATIVLTDLDDPTSPIPALHHHLSANAKVPAGAPLFAFEMDDGGWEALTKSNWLQRCNTIWTAAGLPSLKGHGFRIGGCTELLLRGTNPDIVCMQGRWKSRAFLAYWRKIQKILPLFISNSFSASRVALVNSSMSSFRSKFSL
jgi:hypothetical protein